MRWEESHRPGASPARIFNGRERPIFHHSQHGVEMYIFLCVLAYHLLAAIETALPAQGMHTSWVTVRDILGLTKLPRSSCR